MEDIEKMDTFEVDTNTDDKPTVTSFKKTSVYTV